MKVKFLTGKDRDHFEQLSELYSIILATEQLERLYIKGSISSSNYTQESLLLLSQFKTQQELLNYEYDKVNEFIREYNLNCPAAQKRLKIGVPCTVEHSTFIDKSPKLIAEIVQYFITIMDSIKLQIVDVDQLHPLLSDLLKAFNRTGLESKKLKDWLVLLNQKKAFDQLDGEESRQFLFDLETCYAEFQYSLK